MNALFYLRALAALGATCLATAFRRARRSTTSFASSDVMTSGGRSGPSCIWRCASGWAGMPAPLAAAVLDSQSVKSAEKGAVKTTKSGLRRRQAGEGPQNPRPGPSEGLPMRVVVHSAAIQDRDGAGPHAGSTARAEPASETLPETGPLRRGWREGEPQTLPVIRLRRRDQQGSTHITAGVLPRQAMRFRAKLTGS